MFPKCQAESLPCIIFVTYHNNSKSYLCPQFTDKVMSPREPECAGRGHIAAK